MRALLLIAPAACSEKSPEPAPAAIGEVSAATLVTVADAARIGWVESSGKWSAHWRPDFASASAAGDFGFTTEPFSGENTAFGYCLTVLCQQPDPDWRWIYEGGLDTPDQTKRIAPLMSSSSPPLSRGESAADLAQSAVAVLEFGLAANAAAALKAGPHVTNFSQLRSYAAAAGTCCSHSARRAGTAATESMAASSLIRPTDGDSPSTRSCRVSRPAAGSDSLAFTS